MERQRILAVIFDLDGTLLDTEMATGGVLKDFLWKYGKLMDAEKEKKRVGQMHRESAAAIVRDYELPLTAEEYSNAIMPLYQERWSEAKALPGADRLIKHLHKHGIPLALASNSMRKNIDIKISHQQGWKQSFSVILGGDDVIHGKPSPDIFLKAAKQLGVPTSNCLVIEDSLVGLRAAKASGANVVAVPSLYNQIEQYSPANEVLHSLLDFQPEAWGLPSFDDWTQDALPIEPLFIEGLKGDIMCHGSFSVVNVSSAPSSLELVPVQLCGVFFGRANIKNCGMYNAAVAIGWDICSGIPKRVIKPYLIDPINRSNEKEFLHLLLIGYIRRLKNEDDMTKTIEASEEDLNIAKAALKLPKFSYNIANGCHAELTLE